MQSATIYCPRCGTANDPQMPYCAQCGTTLTGNQSLQGSNTVVQNNLPIAPPPPPTSYGTFPQTESASYLLAPLPPPVYTQPTALVPQRKRVISPLLIAGIIVALLLVIGGRHLHGYSC